MRGVNVDRATRYCVYPTPIVAETTRKSDIAGMHRRVVILVAASRSGSSLRARGKLRDLALLRARRGQLVLSRI